MTGADDFSGAHDPIGIFLAAGAGIREQQARVDLSVLDIAALIFHLAEQPIPDDLDGSLPEQVLAPEWLAAHPPRTLSALEYPTLVRSVAAPDPSADDEEVTERLRSLGYVE